MEQKITTTIDELIVSREDVIKDYNILIFAKMFATIKGICLALDVDMENISLYNIQKLDEEGYVIHLGKKDETGEYQQMIFEIPTYVINANNAETACNVIKALLEQHNQQEPAGKRVLH